MTEKLRRAVPRQPADWLGFYRFENVQNEPWRACRVLDISPLVAGLELFSLIPDEPVEGAISISLELRGVSRNVVRNEEHNCARVGIEFPEPTELAKEYLRHMNGSRSRW
jgi:hypothetical protein